LIAINTFVRRLPLDWKIVAASKSLSEHYIAIVDDDRSVARAIGRILTIGGYSVRLFASAEEFLADAGHYGCVVLDIQLPGMSGLELEKRIAASDPGMAVVFFSASYENKRELVARQTGRLCVSKPAESQVILEAVARSIQAKRFGPAD
jgi:FixJ family two-component response regulator